jgi:hypothetical protein
MPDLNDILADVGTFLVQSSSSEPLLKENFRKGEIITGNIQAMLDAAGGDQELVKRTQETAALQAQKTLAARAAAVGVDVNAAADRITSLMTDIQASHKEVDSALTTVRQKREVNPFEHPIDYVVSALTLPFAEDKLKGAVDTANTKVQQLSQINTAVQQTAQTYAALKESTSAASVEANAKLASLEARINAQKAALEGIKYNTQGIQVAQEASKDRLAMLFHAQTAIDTEIRLQTDLDSLKLRKEEFQWRKEEKALVDQARTEGKQVDELVIEKINLSRASFGLTPIDGLEAKSALTALKSGASKDLAYHYENGDRIKNTGVPFIGANPAESITALKNIPVNLGEHAKATVELLKDAETALQANKTIDQKNKTAVDQFLNSHVQASVKQQYSMVTPGNLFDIGDIRSYASLTGISDLGITKKLIEPAIKSGQPLDNPKMVMGLVTKMVSDGTLSSAEAQELAVVYQKGVLLNQASRRFTGYGIVLPNNGKNYYTRLPGLGVVDMADPTVISRALARDLSEKLFMKAMKERGNGPELDLTKMNRSDLQFGPKLTFPSTRSDGY